MEKYDDEQLMHMKGVIEALLFVNEKPVTLDQIKKVLNTLTANDIKSIISTLSDEYKVKKSGMNIVEIAGGYQMLSNHIYASYLRAFYKTKHKEKLSKPSLECMAIIAYKQPVTRSDIELIRGVNSDGVVVNLLDKELIKIVGRKDVPGRPYLYGTTKIFLEYFGLKSLEDLPKLEEFPDLLPAEDKEEEKLSIEEMKQRHVEEEAAKRDAENEQENEESQEQQDDDIKDENVDNESDQDIPEVQEESQEVNIESQEKDHELKETS